MADAAGAGAPAAKPKAGSSLLTFASIAVVFFILFTPGIRNGVGRYAGYVLDPVFGFGGRWPVLTILLAGTFMVLATTLIRGSAVVRSQHTTPGRCGGRSPTV